jgi:ribonuclease HI
MFEPELYSTDEEMVVTMSVPTFIAEAVICPSVTLFVELNGTPPLLLNCAELETTLSNLLLNDADEATYEADTDNRLELNGIRELLLVLTTLVRDTIVVVTDALRFVNAVDADELKPVVVADTEDDKLETVELNDNREDDTASRLELTGISELLFVLTTEVRATMVVVIDELNPVVVVETEDDKEESVELRTSKEDDTDNRLELIGMIELLFVLTTPVRDTIVVVTEELRFVSAVEADELKPVVVVAMEDDSAETDELSVRRDDETANKLELTGMTELLLVDTKDVRETIVVVNDAEMVVSVVDSELEYACAFIANEAVPKKEPVICEPLIIEAVI